MAADQVSDCAGSNGKETKERPDAGSALRVPGARDLYLLNPVSRAKGKRLAHIMLAQQVFENIWCIQDLP